MSVLPNRKARSSTSSAEQMAEAIASIMPSKQSAKAKIKIKDGANVHALLANGGAGRQRGPTSVSQAQRQLLNLQTAAKKTLEAFESLRPEAFAVFRDPNHLKQTIRMVEIISGWAAQVNETQFAEWSGTASASAPTSKPVRPPVWLALHAALVFLEVTGKRPTLICADGKKGGPYLDFLFAVFRIRGIKSSVENCGKEALVLLSAMEKETPKTNP